MSQKNNKKKNINPIDCTTPEGTKRIYIPYIDIPKDLKVALHFMQNNFIDYYFLPAKCSDYIKCIKSFSNVQRIEYQNYLTIFKICLYLEQNELNLEMRRYMLTNHKIKKGDSNECFIISVPSLDSEKPIIMLDDIVMLYEVVTKKRIKATVTKVVGNEVTIRMRSSVTTKMFDKDKKFNVHFHSQNWPLRCCHYALMLTSKYNLVEIMYPQLKTNYMHLEDDIEFININISKNKEQRQAVKKVLNNTAHPAPYIIFGPPGTGKTATLVEIICQIMTQRPTKNVLVCTASNAAADEITMRLIRNIPKYMVYRMYAPSRQWEDVNKNIQECANFVDKTTIFLPKILLLKKVIITTLVTSIRLAAVKFRENHFSYIIIDEASQAIEPEMLIPLTLTKREDKTKFQAQIVIAGDPYQLGPVVRCKFTQHLLGRSMLERLMNDFHLYKKQDGKYNSNYVTKLVKNYRSHKHILHVSNKEFYEEELKSCGGAETQMALGWRQLPKKNFPLIFQEVLGLERRTSTRSVYNEAEVQVVMKYVKMLNGTKFGEYIIKEKDIGIITLFKQQQLKIIHQLAAKGLKNISVGTVETFQGQERTVIILSTVRSKIFVHDGKEHIGFLSNSKRFNVAITRAKALMIIVGNPKILCTDKYWKVLWEYCNENGGYIPFGQCPLESKVIADLKNDYEAYVDNEVSKLNATANSRLSVTVNLKR